MSYLTADGSSNFGSMLSQLLMVDQIEPGSVPSYQLCKGLYLFHPVGLKMAESPIRMAQSQQRQISVGTGPKDDLQRTFIEQWRTDGASKVIFQHATLARIYGIASIALVVDGKKPDALIDFSELHKLKIAFSVFDPLNTSGSLILNQNPDAIDFLKVPDGVRVSGQNYHKSRVRVMMNEQPIYLGYTDSSFGYVGRSVYQRALFPLKSFIQSMITDDLVTLKAGVLIAKIKQPGSVIDNVMSSIAAVKRMFVKVATTGNVVQIGEDDEITSLNLQNLDGVHDSARKHIIENIATAADMPAKLLLQETFAEGFGEGTEDTKHVARFIDRTREELEPDYRFMDDIVMHRAWNPDYYETLKAKYPDDLGSKDYRQFFYEARNSFTAKWPNLLTEPDSEKAVAEKAKHDAIIGTVETLAPLIKDPENRARLVTWVCDNLNENKIMFPAPLNLDEDAMIEYQPEPSEGDRDELQEPAPPRIRGDAADNIRKLPALR
ncbi:MAG TPA: hypothetical protein VMV19_19405 [Xanthobacteraceae bacterium]|nr:hypothetical protein [Xanthobacteraceae bacterium]